MGLPAPDLVVYLDLSADTAEQREQFGTERYEVAQFQEQVKEQFSQMVESNWMVLNAAQSIDSLHRNILRLAQSTITEKAHTPIASLWT